MPRVLIIEADSDLRTILLLALQRSGYTVRGAPDGARGLELISEFRPDLIVLDMELPGLNGWAVIRRLRASGLRSAPVIGMTTHFNPTYHVQALLAGFCEVLGKPFDLIDFLGAVAAHLRGGHQRQEFDAQPSYC